MKRYISKIVILFVSMMLLTACGGGGDTTPPSGNVVPLDTDGDGIPNSTDTDDDNDGVLDINDAFPLDANESIDTDGDGIGNNTDLDDDGDGVADDDDTFPLNANESVDTDTDSIGNNADTDDDNDGVLDINDAFPLDPAESVDSDGDGVGDNADRPIAHAQHIVMNANMNHIILLTGSDDTATPTFNILSSPAHGALDTSHLPQLIYTPQANYVGADSFTFNANDGEINSSISNVSIEIHSMPTASGFNMTLDVNQSTVVADWKSRSSAVDLDGDSLTATIKTQGNYGTFVVTGDALSYLKTVESNTTDTGILEITDGTNTIEITIMIHALYWKEISAGLVHSVAIKSDGTLWAWGFNFSGMLGDGTGTTRKTPVQEASHSTNWTAVSAGREHTVALKSDGTLWAWGRNNYGQLGTGNTSNKSIPTQEESNSTNWTAISANSSYTLALKDDGTLWGWGVNSRGQLGDNTTVNKVIPTQEASHSTHWISISAGVSHSLGLKDNGTLWAWGVNHYGQLGDGSTTQSLIPIQEASLSTNWIKISANYEFSLGIKEDGTLWAWGRNNYGQLGDGTNTSREMPTQEVSSSSWREVSAGGYAARQYAIGIKTNGTLWSWGKNEYGQLGDGTNINRNIPIQEYSLSTNWSHIYGSEHHSMAIKTNGTLWIWGANEYGEHGNNTTDTRKEIPTQEIFKRQTWLTISAGFQHTMAIKSDGTLWGWGNNSFGQLGQATVSSTELAPVQESTLSTHWSKVDTGENYTIALKDDGTLWAWGGNTYGQLGDNTTITKVTPTQEYSASTNWIEISSGMRGCAAIKSDGTLWAWGGNTYGQLGDNSTTHRKQPTQEASNSTDWIAVDKGNTHTLALKSDGTLWAWGRNTEGQLGNGTTTHSHIPTQESTLATDWSHISGGHEHSLALKSNGTLWAWGSNGSGELGINSTTDQQVPTQEYSLNNDWVSISAGGSTNSGVSMAIKDNGTLWAWGSGNSSILGNGTVGSKKVPTQEYSQSTTWTEVNIGLYHAIGIKSDHTLWAWGSNNNNILSTDAIIPMQPIKRP